MIEYLLRAAFRRAAMLPPAGMAMGEYLAAGAMWALSWRGAGAAAAGLVGEATPEMVGAVLAGADPTQVASGGRVDVVAHRNRKVLGFEFSLAPPKSVSVLRSLASAEVAAQIDAALDVAVQAALDHLGEAAAWSRKGKGERQGWQRGAGLLAVVAHHETSRAGDPQYHSHIVISNTVQTAEGWRTLDGTLLYDQRPIAATKYIRTLQVELSARLGVQWTEPDRRGVREVLGVPTALIRRWSTRRKQVLAAAKECGLVGEKGLDRVAGATREAKREEDPADRAARWRAEAAEALVGRRRGGAERAALVVTAAVAVSTGLPDGAVADALRGLADPDGTLDAAVTALEARRVLSVTAGLDADLRAEMIARVALGAAGGDVSVAGDMAAAALELMATATRPPRGRTPAGTPEDDEALLRRAAQRLTDTRSVWDRTEAETVFFELTGPATPVARVEALTTRLCAEENLVAELACVANGIELGDRGRQPGWRRWATRQTLAREAEVFDWWRAAVREALPIAAEPQALQNLGADQRAAAVALAARRGGVLSAAAGTGKTTTMRAVAALVAPHRRVVGLAVGEAAAQELDDAGVASTNLARALTMLDARIGDDVLPRGGCWIVDEASMVASDTWLRLVRLADERNAQLIAVGDPAQLEAIGPGGIFEALAHAPIFGGVQLHNIRRARERWERAAQRQLRRRRRAAVDLYHRRGRVRAVGERHDTAAAIEAAADWFAAAKGDRLVLAATNAVVDAVNTQIAQKLRPDPPETTMEWIDDDGEQRHIAYAPGDVVLSTITTRRCRTNGGRPLANGRRWIIEAVGIDGTLRCRSVAAKGRIKVDIPPEVWCQLDRNGRPAIRHGWATTIHRAQGATCTRAALIDDGTLNRRALYVGMTRGRNENLAFGTGTDADVVDSLKAALRRDDETSAALEVHRRGLQAGADEPPKGPSLRL